MKKILVIFTGGTIGSKVCDGIINVEEDGRFALVEAYRCDYGDEIRTHQQVNEQGISGRVPCPQEPQLS